MAIADGLGTHASLKGHFKKRSEKWYLWLSSIPDPMGSVARCPAAGSRLQGEAEASFAAYRDEVRKGGHVDTSRVRLQKLEDEWLPAIKASMKESTHAHYRRNVRQHLVPRLGAQRLSTLSATALNAMYADLLANGRADGTGGLAPKSVKEVHTILHKALHDAVRWGPIGRNPADLAEPPTARSPEMKIWSAEQLRTFLASVADDRLYAMWLLFATTGMRRGEVLGLRWRDVAHRNSRIQASPRVVFVNSMSDLLHEDVPIGFIRDVFEVVAETPRHTYQVPTYQAIQASGPCCRLAAVALEPLDGRVHRDAALCLPLRSPSRM